MRFQEREVLAGTSWQPASQKELTPKKKRRAAEIKAEIEALKKHLTTLIGH
jgi:hypothetical protein